MNWSTITIDTLNINPACNIEKNTFYRRRKKTNKRAKRTKQPHKPGILLSLIKSVRQNCSVSGRVILRLRLSASNSNENSSVNLVRRILKSCESFPIMKAGKSPKVQGPNGPNSLRISSLCTSSTSTRS